MNSTAIAYVMITAIGYYSHSHDTNFHIAGNCCQPESEGSEQTLDLAVERRLPHDYSTVESLRLRFCRAAFLALTLFQICAICAPGHRRSALQQPGDYCIGDENSARCQAQVRFGAFERTQADELFYCRVTGIGMVQVLIEPVSWYAFAQPQS